MSDVGPKHLVFDCETLGKQADAVVVSIGAVLFDFTDEPTEDNFKKMIQDGIHIKFSVEDQITFWKRKTEQSTLDWWAEQSREAREVLKPSEYDFAMVKGLEALNKWIKESPYSFNRSYCWSRGTYFDFPKFYSMYAQAGFLPAFNGWKIRDVRTMIDCLTGVSDGSYTPRNGVPASFVAHNALHDAAMDAYRMIDIFDSQRS